LNLSNLYNGINPSQLNFCMTYHAPFLALLPHVLDTAT